MLREVEEKHQKRIMELEKVCKDVYSNLKSTLYSIRNICGEKQFTSIKKNAEIPDFIIESPETLTKLSKCITLEFSTISTARMNKIIEKSLIL